METHLQHLMQALDLHTPDGAGWTDEINLLPLFFNLTLDSATEFLFGQSVESQLDGIPGAKLKPKYSDVNFAYVFDEVLRCLVKAARLGDLYWFGHTRKFIALAKESHRFVDGFVQLALSQGTEEKQGQADDSNKYVFLQALAKETQDPVELRFQLLNILLAGRDTTASLLGWLFLLLSEPEHLHIFKRLRSAVIEQFGTYKHPKSLTFSTLKDCVYLQWCLNETLRLYPIVSINSRKAVVDTTIPTGGGPDGSAPVYIKKGTQVVYSVAKPSFIHYFHKILTLEVSRSMYCTGERTSGARTPRNSNPSAGTGVAQAGTTCRSMAGHASASASSSP